MPLGGVGGGRTFCDARKGYVSRGIRVKHYRSLPRLLRGDVRDIVNISTFFDCLVRCRSSRVRLPLVPLPSAAPRVGTLRDIQDVKEDSEDL